LELKPQVQRVPKSHPKDTAEAGGEKAVVGVVKEVEAGSAAVEAEAVGEAEVVEEAEDHPADRESRLRCGQKFSWPHTIQRPTDFVPLKYTPLIALLGFRFSNETKGEEK
jgi:hypothetical protein